MQTRLRAIESHQSFTPRYAQRGATFQSGRVTFGIDGPSIARQASSWTPRLQLRQARAFTSYVAPAFTESYRSVASGVEQSFSISRRLPGAGRLVVEMPVTGLRAEGFGSSISLVAPGGRIEELYSKLTVRDRRGHVVPSSMSASDGGHAISLSIDDARAAYPLRVDPTIISVVGFEGPGADYEYGSSVGASGTAAAVGAPEYPVNGSATGGVYMYAFGAAGWAALNNGTPYTAPGAPSGANFGWSVAMAGSTLAVAAPGQTSDGSTSIDGAVYVYNEANGSWSGLTPQEIDGSSSYGGFATSVALSQNGSELVIGVRNIAGGDEGFVVYVDSGGTWTEEGAPVTTLADNGYAQQVAIDGSNVLVGADTYSSDSGAVIGYGWTGSTWSQVGSLITPSGYGNSFGTSVALSGSYAVVGATYEGESGPGAFYELELSSGAWTVADGPVTPPTTPGCGGVGTAVAMAGSTIVVADADNVGNEPPTGGCDYPAFEYEVASGGLTYDGGVGVANGCGCGQEGAASVSMSGGTTALGVPDYCIAGGCPIGETEILPTGDVGPQGVAFGPLEPSGGGPPSECSCAAVNAPVHAHTHEPIDTANGDLYESETDLALPGPGVPLAFTRTYDAATAQATYSGAEPPLGYGWTDNLASSLYDNTSNSIVTVTQENGSQITFTPFNNQTWCSGGSGQGVTYYCERAQRYNSTLQQNADGTWTMVRLSGVKRTLYFSATTTTTPTGYLTSIADDLGNTLTESTYAPVGQQIACPASDTCSAWTSSASTRELVIATTASGRIAQVFDANSSLAATFSYSGCTKELCGVTDPGGLTYSYTYGDDGCGLSFMQYDLLTEVAPGTSAPTTNSYSCGTTKAPAGWVSQQTDPAGGVLTLDYSGLSLTGSGSTTATSFPQGTGTGEPQIVTTYLYANSVLQGQFTGTLGDSDVGAQTYVREASFLMPKTVTDGDGNTITRKYATATDSGDNTWTTSPDILTSTDGLGNKTTYAYNADDEVYCTVDPAEGDDGATCPSSPPSMPSAGQDPYPGASITYYNSSFEPIGTTDELGNTSKTWYTVSGFNVPVGLPYCTVDAVAYASGISCPAYGATHVAGTTTETYDADGDVTATTDPLGEITRYTYSSTYPGMIATVTDPDGTVTTFSYDSAEQVTSKTVSYRSFSEETLYGYTPSGNANDPPGTLFCEASPFEVGQGVTCPSGPGSSPVSGATNWTYDADGRVTSIVNPLGGTTSYAYDQAGDRYCTVSATAYAQGVRCLAVGTADPGATVDTFDTYGRVTQSVNPLGATTTYSYDGADNVTETDVASGQAGAPTVTTQFTYNADDELTQKTIDPGANAQTTLYAYDPNGDLYCTKSPDAVARGDARCAPWTASWIMSPPLPSNLYGSSSNQANDVTTTFTDDDGDVVQSTDPDVSTSITAYDGDGRAYCSSDPVNVAAWLTAHPSSTYPYLCPSIPPSSPPTGSTTGYETTIFDQDGNVTSSTDQVGDTTSYTYDGSGNVLTVSDPRGEVTTNCYYWQNGTGQCANGSSSNGGSADDLYSTTTPVTAADPNGETTTYTYGQDGLLTTLTTPAGSRTRFYYTDGLLSSELYSGTASGYTTPPSIAYTYNVDGSRASSTDAAGTTTYGYDDAGDLVSQQLTASATLTNQTTGYGYYPTGQLKSVTYPSYAGHSSPTVTYAYDETGAMASSTDWLGNVVDFGHDTDGNLTSQENDVSSTNPSGTSSTTYTYDPADVNASAASTMTQTCGGTETLAQGFGTSSGGSVNADDQLTQDVTSYTGSCSGQGSTERNYAYDAAGRVVFEGTSPQGSSSNNFAYDASGDPTTISSHDGSGNFDTYTQAFDSAGEVTSQTHTSTHGSNSTYTYDTLGDQITATTGTSTTTYGYNQLGQLASVTPPSGATSRVLTDGDGLEVGSTGFAPPVAADGSRAVTAISCASSTFCMAVDASGYAAKFNGTSWSASDVDGSNHLTAISCPTTTWCMAVDQSGNAVKYNAGTWTTSHVDGSNVLTAISCTSSSFCLAGDASGNWLKYTGSWTVTSLSASDSFQGISCTSTTSCFAAVQVGTRSSTGDGFIYNGSWGTGHVLTSSHVITAVSCTSSTFCEFLDASGYAYQYSSGWPSGGTSVGASTSVSCKSTTFCLATDGVGGIYSYTGTWSSALDEDSANALVVSCSSTKACAAADSAGQGLTYTAVASPTQLVWSANGGLPVVLSDGTSDYLYGPGSTPIEQVTLSSSTPTYLTYTPTDGTWLTTNEAGNQTGFWQYDAFGNLSFGTPTTQFGYAGAYVDPISGLSNLRARDYEPETGSFTTRDPAFSATDTAYTYAGGDPVNGSDPTGLWGWNLLSDTGEAYNDTVGAGIGEVAGPGGCVDFPVAACSTWQGDVDYTGSLVKDTLTSAIQLGCLATQQLSCPTPDLSWLVPYGGCPASEASALAAVNVFVAWLAIPGAGEAADAGDAVLLFEEEADAGGVGTVAGGSGVAEPGNWPQLAGIIQDAAKGKGNFGLGDVTASEANEAGLSWVGDSPKVASDGKTLISQDGLRQFRPPTFKPQLGIWQANLESRLVPRGAWQSNGHLNITDLP